MKDSKRCGKIYAVPGNLGTYFQLNWRKFTGCHLCSLPSEDRDLAKWSWLAVEQMEKKGLSFQKTEQLPLLPAFTPHP